MRIGLISDVHSNVRGLKTTLEQMADVDDVLCAGDLVYQYLVSNEIFDVVREHKIRFVQGNHEKLILSHFGKNIRSSGVILPENLEMLQNAPSSLCVQVDGKRLLMVHGSPWDSPWGHKCEYIYPNDKKIVQMGQIGADYIVLGHTHYPMVERAGSVTVINPGSCGEARDHSVDLHLTYAILDTATGEVEIKQVEGYHQVRGWSGEAGSENGQIVDY